jgi:hypothetical protein
MIMLDSMFSSKSATAFPFSQELVRQYNISCRVVCPAFFVTVEDIINDIQKQNRTNPGLPPHRHGPSRRLTIYLVIHS